MIWGTKTSNLWLSLLTKIYFSFDGTHDVCILRHFDLQITHKVNFLFCFFSFYNKFVNIIYMRRPTVSCIVSSDFSLFSVFFNKWQPLILGFFSPQWWCMRINMLFRLLQKSPQLECASIRCCLIFCQVKLCICHFNQWWLLVDMLLNFVKSGTKQISGVENYTCTFVTLNATFWWVTCPSAIYFENSV